MQENAPFSTFKKLRNCWGWDPKPHHLLPQPSNILYGMGTHVAQGRYYKQLVVF